jgi:hypothetical protein
MTSHASIPRELQVLSLLVLAAFLVWVVRLVRTQRLTLRDSLVWVLTTLAAAVLTIFPRLLLVISEALGFQVASNAIFGAAVLYLAVNVLVTTVASSVNAARLRRLSQEHALLRAELEELRRRGGGPEAGS